MYPNHGLHTLQSQYFSFRPELNTAVGILIVRVLFFIYILSALFLQNRSNTSLHETLATLIKYHK